MWWRHSVNEIQSTNHIQSIWTKQNPFNSNFLLFVQNEVHFWKKKKTKKAIEICDPVYNMRQLFNIEHWALSVVNKFDLFPCNGQKMASGHLHSLHRTTDAFNFLIVQFNLAPSQTHFNVIQISSGIKLRSQFKKWFWMILTR